MNWDAACIIALLTIGVWAGCRKAPEIEIPPQPVETAVAVQRDVPLYIETFGNCTAIASVTIQPQVTGKLIDSPFKEGAFVRRDDIVARIDPAPYQAALAQAEGNLKSAQGALALARQNLERQQNLYNTRVSSVQELQTAEANADEAQGNLLAAEAALASARINLDYCTIASPIAGRTGMYLVDVGNLVTANQTKLVNIRTIDPIYVDYTISENQMVQVRRYLDRDGLDVEVALPGDDGYRSAGKLTFIDNSVAADTGTLRLRATVPNRDEKLWPGLFVNVRLILATIDDAVVVPDSAIVTGQESALVYVVADDGGKPDATVALRPVKTGQRQGADIVIEQGIEPGERVVTSGQIGLYSGKKVTLAAPGAARPAGSPPPSPPPASSPPRQ